MMYEEQGFDYLGYYAWLEQEKAKCSLYPAKSRLKVLVVKATEYLSKRIEDSECILLPTVCKLVPKIQPRMYKDLGDAPFYKMLLMLPSVILFVLEHGCTLRIGYSVIEDVVKVTLTLTNEHNEHLILSVTDYSRIVTYTVCDSEYDMFFTGTFETMGYVNYKNFNRILSLVLK